MTATPTLTAPATLTSAQRDVITAADSLFTENGISPVSVEQIAQRAGLSPAALADAFESKRDILIAVLAWKHQGWMHKLAWISATTTDPRDEILNIFSYLEECFTDTSWRGCAFINAYGELGRSDDGIGALAAEHFSEVERHIGVLCERAGMPSHVAETLTLLIQGARAESGIHHTVRPARAARLGAAMLMSVYQDDDALPDFS
ncbi:TetR/AcrR family transcriptional regulator [Frigoribacterium sp. 2-23]|uniref:TetR/AcrR family transcriptional regulator n=1 Tax=Frigoribacterium sp. 2-23 TaxID=3415006 RepID=UPI003C6EA531